MSKALVIVDVQKEFDEYIQHDLVDALSDYAEKFDTVYQIWDTHNDSVAPTHSFPGQIDSVPKKFGKKHFSKEVQEYIKNLEASSTEGRTFKLSNGGYVVRVKNNHDWFYVNPEIVKLIQQLKGRNVILVGGADGECLEDIYQAFLAFGLNVHINKKYTYSAKTSQDDSIKEKILIPRPPKKLNEEFDNDAESCREICINIKTKDEFNKLKDIIADFPTHSNEFPGYFDPQKAPYYIFLAIDENNLGVGDVVSWYDKSDPSEYNEIKDYGITDSSDFNYVYNTIFTVNDEDTIKRTLRDKKLVIVPNRPSYKPKTFIHEGRTAETAEDICIRVDNRRQGFELENIAKQVFPHSIFMEWIKEFPCYVFLNIKFGGFTWLPPNKELKSGFEPGTTTVPDTEHYKDVYPKIFKMDEILIIKTILYTKEIPQLINESFDIDNETLVFQPKNPKDSEEAQRFAFSKGYGWGPTLDNEIQYTDQEEGKFLTFSKSGNNELMILRIPSTFIPNNLPREEQLAMLDKNVTGTPVYTNNLNTFKILLGGSPSYKPKQFIRENKLV